MTNAAPSNAQVEDRILQWHRDNHHVPLSQALGWTQEELAHWYCSRDPSPERPLPPWPPKAPPPTREINERTILLHTALDSTTARKLLLDAVAEHGLSHLSDALIAELAKLHIQAAEDTNRAQHT